MEAILSEVPNLKINFQSPPSFKNSSSQVTALPGGGASPPPWLAVAPASL